jgi:hypothetical protein
MMACESSLNIDESILVTLTEGCEPGCARIIDPSATKTLAVPTLHLGLDNKTGREKDVYL